MAATAGTSPSNVDILQVTEVRRRAGSIDVDTKVVYLLIRVGRGSQGGRKGGREGRTEGRVLKWDMHRRCGEGVGGAVRACSCPATAVAGSFCGRCSCSCIDSDAYAHARTHQSIPHTPTRWEQA